MPLYHRSVHGLPPIALPTLAGLALSIHAAARAKERHIPLDVLTSFNPATYPVFQVETLPTVGGGERIIKINYRRRLDRELDYAVCLSHITGQVISCWVQWRTFQPSIDRAAYSRPVPGKAYTL